MFFSETTIRVRYAETDQMGFVYYGNYAQYFEVGRVEALRQLGLSYREMEEKGIMLPVYTFSVKYMKPAYYDDQLTIKTILKEMPKSKIAFEYETYNESGELLNAGETSLVFIDVKTKRPCGAPQWFRDKIKDIFSENK